jgi:hypothetical protein
MDDQIDYSQHTEPELVDMFGRLDPDMPKRNVPDSLNT